MCDDCTSSESKQARQVQIQLPAEILELPLEQRVKVIQQLAKSMDIKTDVRAQAADIMDNFGAELTKVWMPHNDPVIAELEDTVYNELAVPLWNTMLDLYDVLGLDHLSYDDIEKSFSENEFLHTAGNIRFAELLQAEQWDELIKSDDYMDMDKVKERYGGKKPGDGKRAKKPADAPYAGDGGSFTQKQLQTLDSVLARYGVKSSSIAERIAVSGTYLGKLIEAFEGNNEILRRGIVELLPVTIEQRHTIDDYALTKKEAERTGMPLLPLQDQELNALQWAKDHAAEKIGDIDDKMKQRIRAVIVNARKNRLSPKEIETLLFDKFGEINRDMRRIALTEVAEATNNGYLMGLTHAQPLTILGADNACDFCKGMQGKDYIFVDPDQTQALDWDNMIWVGKSNYGRKRAEWKACCPGHPHCRDRYVKYNPKFQKIEDGRITIKKRDEIIGDAMKAKLQEE